MAKKLVALILLAITIFGYQNTHAQQNKKIIETITIVANHFQVSPYVLLAIAEHESFYWPFAINIRGKSFWPKNKKEALQLIKNQKSYDLGIMQVNSWWLDKMNIPPSKAIDLDYNIILGGYILADCQKRYKTLEKTLSCYHAGRPSPKGNQYAQKVKKIYLELSSLAKTN